MSQATDLNPMLLINEGTLKTPQSVFNEATQKVHWAEERPVTIWPGMASSELDITPTRSIASIQQKQIELLESRVSFLESKIAQMEKWLTQDSSEEIEIRAIPYDQAKKEIRQFFKDHHGEHFDAADIQERLGIDIVVAINVLETLREEGKIK